MAAKHTPGPWRVVGELILAGDEDLVARIANYDLKSAALVGADARLIATAPEMLDLIVASTATPGDACSDCNEIIGRTMACTACAYFRTASALVAKARGE